MVGATARLCGTAAYYFQRLRELIVQQQADKKNHINEIENFWNQAKRHLRKFKGILKESFWLFLEECEWRFNNPSPKEQITQLKQWIETF